MFSGLVAWKEGDRPSDTGNAVRAHIGAASVAAKRAAGIAGHRPAASYRRPPENRRLTQGDGGGAPSKALSGVFARRPLTAVSKGV